MNDGESGVTIIRRVLFVSWTCYLDDANGASVASRAMLEALVRLGFSVRVLCGPVLERRDERDIVSFLSGRGLSPDVRDCGSWQVGPIGLLPQLPRDLRLVVRGVPITVMAGSTQWRAPTDDQCREFLAFFDQVWDEHQPDMLITYGDRQPILEILSRAKARGATIVFPLHNLGYHDRAVFADVDVILVASQFGIADLAIVFDCEPNRADWQSFQNRLDQCEPMRCA